MAGREIVVLCPCGCRAPVTAGNKYASPGCWHRVLTPERRSGYSTEGRAYYRRRVETICACGCGETFMRKAHGTRAGQRYVSSLHAAKHRRNPEFREWHKARLQKAFASRAANARKAAQERAKGLTPEQAYAKGYQVGYNNAYHRWKLWAEGRRRRTA